MTEQLLLLHHNDARNETNRNRANNFILATRGPINNVSRYTIDSILPSDRAPEVVEL